MSSTHWLVIRVATNYSPTRIKGLRGSLNVTEIFTSISINIALGIICKRCHIIYIGKTGIRLADRITEHFVLFEAFFFLVAKRFNPPSHCSLNDFSVIGIIQRNCPNGSRSNKSALFFN